VARELGPMGRTIGFFSVCRHEVCSLPLDSL